MICCCAFAIQGDRRRAAEGTGRRDRVHAQWRPLLLDAPHRRERQGERRGRAGEAGYVAPLRLSFATLGVEKICEGIAKLRTAV